MSEIDAATLAEQVVLLGLTTQDQAYEAMAAAEDGSFDGLASSLLRRGSMTRWQVDKFRKGDLSGFFYGGCKVLFHLAEGTFARVYRGVRTATGQPVAIKVLRQRFLMDPGAVDRFGKEAEAGLKLHHLNIVEMFDYGEQDKRHFMVMEYVEGSNLRDFLKIRVWLTEKAALPLVLGLAQGLQYSLDRGITHRDIKGTNILVSSNGVAKLVDFGLATIGGDDKRMAVAHGLRTVDYSALERTCGSPKGDPRSDIFFLGCVFYQMLTGQLAMSEAESKDPLAKMLKRSFGAIKPLNEQRHAPSEELTRIVEKMMRVDLKARYQNMEEVVRDLEAHHASFLSGSGPVVAPPPPTPDEPDSRATAPGMDPAEINDVLVEFREDAFVIPAVRPKTVLCVESQEAIQEAFRQTLSAMGYRVFLVSDAERAAERYRESPPDAVIFDADGLGPRSLQSFIDMHDKAHAEGHPLTALVLLGPRQQADQQKLPTDDHLIVLSKPIKMKQIQDAIQSLLPLH